MPVCANLYLSPIVTVKAFSDTLREKDGTFLEFIEANAFRRHLVGVNLMFKDKEGLVAFARACGYSDVMIAGIEKMEI